MGLFRICEIVIAGKVVIVGCAASFTMQHKRKFIAVSEVSIGTQAYEIGTVFLVCRDRVRGWLYGYEFLSISGAIRRTGTARARR